MEFNLNKYKETIKDLVNLGIKNYYSSSPLCTQKERLIRDGIKLGLIENRK